MSCHFLAPQNAALCCTFITQLLTQHYSSGQPYCIVSQTFVLTGATSVTEEFAHTLHVFGLLKVSLSREIGFYGFDIKGLLMPNGKHVVT